MLRGQLMELSELLREDEFRTALWLAEKIGVSEKTVRIRIKELKDILLKNGSNVLSKARYGYKLEIDDRIKFEQLITRSKQIADKIPETGPERNEYLLAYLLNQKDYIKMDYLCEFLFISKTTLAHSLKSVEYILKRYQIDIDRRPNYGIKIQGSEMDIRRLISEYFVKRNGLNEVNRDHQEMKISQLAKDIRQLLIKYEIHLSELAFEHFLDYVYVAGKRMMHGNYIKMEKENLFQIGLKEQSFVKELIELLTHKNNIPYTEDEENYLLLYLAGKRIIGSVVENDSNFIIHEQTDRLALSMMDEINKEFHIDLRNNFDTRMALNQHLVPFDIRIRYDIPLVNPLLNDMKTKYSLAYEMAYHASRVLREHYNKEISEDEIGYFSFIFALALEKDKKEQLYNILVVCSTGKGSSRLLKYQYEQEFADYIRNIYVCDWVGLENFDYTKVDYVFTTIPITVEVPVPILEVGMFLGTKDIQKVSHLLKRGNQEYLSQYYREKRFLTNIKGKTKEAVLEALCKVIQTQEEVDDNFYDLVIERESYAQMDYGNLIAIPHPNQISSEVTFAYVAVLPEPIIWNQHPVQVILLTSIGRRPDSNRQKFYESTARFALDKESVQALIANPEYSTLIDLLQL